MECHEGEEEEGLENVVEGETMQEHHYGEEEEDETYGEEVDVTGGQLEGIMSAAEDRHIQEEEEGI